MGDRRTYTGLAPGTYSWGLESRLEVPASGEFTTEDPAEIYYLEGVLGHPADSVETYSASEDLTVDELRDRLAARGLETDGLKDELVERLDADVELRGEAFIAPGPVDVPDLNVVSQEEVDDASSS